MSLHDFDACASCGAHPPDGTLYCVACGARRHDDPRLGTVVLGRYLLVEQLGAGGMGTVYRATQRVGPFTRSVAVKILHPEMSAIPALRARFEQECALVISLSHANTIRFFDFDELEDGALAIVMEHVPGETLAARLERGPLPPTEAIRVASEIAASLEEAHARGVIHRDLKPDNVMLYPRPGLPDGVKVLDFGVAKKRSGDVELPAITFRGEVLGTPAYMSPEQITGEHLDPRSDVYSLGVVVYEMLTGEYPYSPAASLAEWADRHLNERPLSIEAHAVGEALGAGASEALMRALEKRAVDRPRSVRELVDGLRGRAAPTPSEAEERVTEPDLPRPRVEDDEDPVVVPRARRPWLVLAFAAAIALGFAYASSALVARGEEAIAASPAKVATESPSEVMVARCEPGSAGGATDGSDARPECQTL